MIITLIQNYSHKIRVPPQIFDKRNLAGPLRLSPLTEAVHLFCFIFRNRSYKTIIGLSFGSQPKFQPHRSCTPFVSYSPCSVRYTQGFSIPTRKQVILLARRHNKKRRFLALFLLCPRQESNLHQSLRRALFYPLNYEGRIVN